MVPPACLTITRARRLMLNAPAYALLGMPNRAVLLCDRDENLIALRASTSEDDYAVTPLIGGHGFTVAGRAFLDHFGISKSGRRRVRFSDSLLICDLNQPTTRARREAH